MTRPETSAQENRAFAMTMYVGAVVTLIVAIVLGAVVAPVLYAVALLAIVDVWLARRTMGHAREADPSSNPYARED